MKVKNKKHVHREGYSKVNRRGVESIHCEVCGKVIKRYLGGVEI